MGNEPKFQTDLERELYEALFRAHEELRLLRMKDTGAVYDVGLRIDIEAALRKARGEA